jgi:hypothetical protein
MSLKDHVCLGWGGRAQFDCEMCGVMNAKEDESTVEDDFRNDLNRAEYELCPTCNGLLLFTSKLVGCLILSNAFLEKPIKKVQKLSNVSDLSYHSAHYPL